MTITELQEFLMEAIATAKQANAQAEQFLATTRRAKDQAEMATDRLERTIAAIKNFLSELQAIEEDLPVPAVSAIQTFKAALFKAMDLPDVGYMM
jgi:hypothetical protein